MAFHLNILVNQILSANIFSRKNITSPNFGEWIHHKDILNIFQREKILADKILLPWAPLFKANNAELCRLTIKYGIYANIFAEKNVSSICRSYSHFFSKNTC